MLPAKLQDSNEKTANIYTVQLEYYPDCYMTSSEEGSSHLLPNWNRVFKLTDGFTLEQLASMIIEILGWEEDHLYEFHIGGRIYVNMGSPDFSDYVVDATDPCVSCAIRLHYLHLNIDNKFEFIFDFGRYHVFRITVVDIAASLDKKQSVSLVSYSGQNLLQYPEQLSENEKTSLLDKPPKIKHPTANPVGQRWQIRFIRETDFSTLLEWRKSANKDLWDKAVAVLENRNLTIEQLSEKIERSENVIISWVNAFNHHGINGLNPPRKKRSGDWRQEASLLMTKRLLEILHDRPMKFDINRASWNLATLAMAYNKLYEVKPSRTTVGRLLKSTGYTFKKARRVLTSPDPEYREKVEQVLNTLQNIKPDELFFFIDEMGPLRVKKYGGNAIVHKDDVLTYPQAERHRGSITMAAALSATTNQVTWLYGPKKDSQAMIDLIEILFNQYPKATRIYLTWDAASWHSSNQLVEWLDAFNADTVKSLSGPVIQLVPLPTSSQFLDVIESIFSGMKKAVIHHSNYNTEDEMKTAISRHFMERNAYFAENPKRVGKKIWEVDFFQDTNNMRSGNYREW